MTNPLSLPHYIHTLVTCGILATALATSCSLAIAQTNPQVAADIGALKKVPFEELFDIKITSLA